MAVTGDISDHSQEQDHIVPNPGDHVSSTSAPTITFSTSAQMLPPPPGPLDKSKSIWAPGWVNQPEGEWTESLRRGSNVTVSPRTRPIHEAGGIAQPDTQLPGPSNSLRTQKVDGNVQKAGTTRSEEAETEYAPPKVALMAYLDRLAKAKGECALRMGEKDRPDIAGERLIEPVYPPVKRGTTKGKRRVMRAHEQSETNVDVDLAGRERGSSRDCQPGLERTAYPILPSFATLIESAGLTDDKLPLFPWETPDSSGPEQSVVASPHSHNHYNPSGSLPEQRSRKMSVTDHKMVDSLTKDESTLDRQQQQHSLRMITLLKQAMAKIPGYQAPPSPERGMVDNQVSLQLIHDGQVSQREHFPTTNLNQPIVVSPTTMQEMQKAMQHLDQNNKRRFAAQTAEYLVEHPEYISQHPEEYDLFKLRVHDLTKTQDLPVGIAGQPSDSSAPMQLQRAAPSHLERHAPPHLRDATPSHLERHAPSHLQRATPSHLERHAPPHIPDAITSHLERYVPPRLRDAASTHLERHAPSHLRNTTPQGSSDGFPYFDGFGFEPESQYHLPALGLEIDSVKAGYGHSAQQSSAPVASQAQLGNLGLSSSPRNLIHPSYGHSTQQSSVPVANQAQGQFQASSPALQNLFHPSYLQSPYSRDEPMQQEFIKPSAPLHTGPQKHQRSESEASHPQTGTQSGYGLPYSYGAGNLTRAHGQSLVQDALQPNMALDNRSYGQGSFANPFLQNTMQPNSSYVDDSLAMNSQPNPAQPVQVSGLNPYLNYQKHVTQSPQYPHGRSVARGRARNSSTRRSQEPTTQLYPSTGLPGWNPQPAATTGIQTMQQYDFGSSQQPQEQAPYGPMVTASSSFAVGPVNQAPSLGSNVHGEVEPMYSYQAAESMPPAKRVRHYRIGGDGMYPHPAPGASAQYQALTKNGPPSLEAAAQGAAMPFVEASKEAGPMEWGVAKIGNVSVP